MGCYEIGFGILENFFSPNYTAEKKIFEIADLVSIVPIRSVSLGLNVIGLGLILQVVDPKSDRVSFVGLKAVYLTLISLLSGLLPFSLICWPHLFHLSNLIPIWFE